MTIPKVSVLVAVYNTQRYVAAAVRSVLAQTLRDIEVIVVDDRSTDDSWAAVQAVAATDARVTAIRRERNAGASSALNEALVLARGEFVTRHDSDDLCRPTRLADQVAFLEANPGVAGVGTAVEVIDADDRTVDIVRFPESDEDIQAMLLERMSFCGPTVMTRRATLAAMAFTFDESLSGSEDYDLCLRLAEVGTLANLSQPVYLYRHHSSSVSRSQQHSQLVRKARALEHAIHRRFGQSPPPDRLRNVARDYLRAAVVGHAMREPAALADCIARALTLEPALLDNGAVVERIVRRYTPSAPPVEPALDFTESLFSELLPPTARLSRLKRKLVAELHINAAFAARSEGQMDRVGPHLWTALANDPARIANRGVLSLVVRGVWRRGRTRAPYAGSSNDCTGARTNRPQA